MEWQTEKNIIWWHKKNAIWWKWKRTTKSQPCPICGKDRCQISGDGNEIVCNRASVSTGGWVAEGRSGDGRTHFTDTIRRDAIIKDAQERQESAKRTYGFKLAPLPPVTPLPARQKVAKIIKKDWNEEYKKFPANLNGQADHLADQLGLPVQTLHALGLGWRTGYNQFTWPHKNDSGQIIGVATRDHDTGQKGAIKPTNSGLFYTDNWDVSGPILLVEGPTDTAALLSFNLTVIGRPSNTGGVEYLASMLRDVPAERNIIVIGEEDHRITDDGAELFPGRDGAISTAEGIANTLNRPILFTFPPKEFKDVREYAAKHEDAGYLLEAFFNNIEIVRPRIEPPTLDGRPPDIEERTLEDYRNEMKANIAAALKVKGFSLDRSATGAGKSWGVFMAFADLPKEIKTLTTTPTHVLCHERAKEMVDWGFPEKSVGVIPQLSEDNCENFDAATKAQEAGFAIGQALCPVCPFQQGCQYIKQCGKAKRAKHLIMPHERLARGDGKEWLQKRGVVVVDEKPELGVAPQVQASIDDLKAVAEYYRQLKSAALPPPSTISLDEFNPNSWADQQMEASNAAMQCLEVAEKLIAEAAPVHKAGAHIVKMKSGTEPDWKTQRALFKIMQDNGIAQPPAEAVRLVGLIVSGAATSVVMTVCGKDKRTKLVTASAVVNLSGKSVLLLDGTGHPGRLEDLLGGEVMDITPSGKIKQVHSLVQIPLPVAKRTSAAHVCRIITALMEMEPDKLFGVITHKSQADKIFGEGGLLPEYLRPNVAKWSYFNEGPDRGSNMWHKKCDRLLVIGAPRRPPHAIRAELAARGSDAANELDPQYGACSWTGVTEDGEEKEFRGSAYANEEWRFAHSYLTTADLKQAIGRARITLPEGIPCTVVTDEPLGIPVREMALQARTPQEQRIFTAMLMQSAAEMEIGGYFRNIANKYYIASFLKSPPNPFIEGNRPAIHRTAIVKASGIHFSDVSKLLKRMVDAGVIHQPAHGWYALGVPAVDNPGYIWANDTQPTLSAVMDAIAKHGGHAKRKDIISTAGISAEAFKAIQDNPAITKVGRGKYCTTGLAFEADGQLQVYLRNDDGEPMCAVITTTTVNHSNAVLVDGPDVLEGNQPHQ